MVTLPGISAFFGSSSHRPGPDSKIAMAERIARLDSPRLIRTSGAQRALRPSSSLSHPASSFVAAIHAAQQTTLNLVE